MAQEETMGQKCDYFWHDVQRQCRVFLSMFRGPYPFSQNVINNLRIDVAQHPRRSKTSTSPLREPKIPQTWLYKRQCPGFYYGICLCLLWMVTDWQAFVVTRDIRMNLIISLYLQKLLLKYLCGRLHWFYGDDT